MNKDLHNQFRNLIFNDVGVKRADIKAEVQRLLYDQLETIIREEVTKHLNRENVWIEDKVRQGVKSWTIEAIQNSIRHYGIQDINNATKAHIKGIIAQNVLEGLDFKLDIVKKEESNG